jgi:hypothetical protein
VPDDLRLDVAPGVSVAWPLDGLMRAGDAADPEAEPAWSGEVDWSRFDSLRLLTCTAGDDALAMAVARPSGAERHDADLIACARVGAAGVQPVDEALVSTEYDPNGKVRRIGVELWSADGAGTRLAADRAGEVAATEAGGLAREATPLDFRLDGVPGRGLHELVRPARDG